MIKTKLASLVPMRKEVFLQIVLRGFNSTAENFEVSRGTLDDLVQRYPEEYEQARTQQGRTTSRRAPRREKLPKTPRKRSEHSSDKKEAQTAQSDSVWPVLDTDPSGAEIQIPKDPRLSLMEMGSEELLRMIPEKIHPAANTVPLWPIGQLREGADQLRQLGRLPEPIELLKGNREIIDGRNRRIMCLLSNVQPRFIEIDLPANLSVCEYVELRNIRRRQLSKDQLATYATDLYLDLREKGKTSRANNLRKGAVRNDELQKSAFRGNSLEKLSHIYSVNRRYIQLATKLKEMDEVIFLKVRNGEITLIKALGQVVPSKKRRDPGSAKRKSSPRSSLVSLVNGLMRVSSRTPLELRKEVASLLELARKALRDFTDASPR